MNNPIVERLESEYSSISGRIHTLLAERRVIRRELRAARMDPTGSHPVPGWTHAVELVLYDDGGAMTLTAITAAVLSRFAIISSDPPNAAQQALMRPHNKHRFKRVARATYILTPTHRSEMQAKAS